MDASPFDLVAHSARWYPGAPGSLLGAGARAGSSTATLDQHVAPFVDALRVGLADTIAFSTPGHKGGRGAADEVRALPGARVATTVRMLQIDVVCLITVGDTLESIDRLVDAFVTLSAERPVGGHERERTGCRSAGNILAAKHQALTPREAFFARTRCVPLKEAIGEAAAELVVRTRRGSRCSSQAR